MCRVSFQQWNFEYEGDNWYICLLYFSYIIAQAYLTVNISFTWMTLTFIVNGKHLETCIENMVTWKKICEGKEDNKTIGSSNERGFCWAGFVLSLYLSLISYLLLLLSRFSRVQLSVTPWTAAHQASPSKGFSRQEHWSGLPFPSPRKLLLF